MKNFVWMGGGGAVLKGLDITLEAFSKMPEFNLHVLGPASVEKDFIKEYKKELEETPNINYYGRVDVTGEKFKNIIDKFQANFLLSAFEKFDEICDIIEESTCFDALVKEYCQNIRRVYEMPIKIYRDLFYEFLRF